MSVTTPPTPWSSAEQGLGSASRGNCLIGSDWAKAADSYGEFGLTLLIDQKSLFLI